jgi:hypothetical protein
VLSQFGNRSAAENDNSDEVDNENIAEDDTVQSMSEVRGDNTLKELVSEVKGDNTLKESMLFHETNIQNIIFQIIHIIYFYFILLSI